MKDYLILLLILIPFLGVSQNILMGDGSSTQCSGTFLDSGGQSGNYGLNENFTFTICPDNPGDKVRISFSEFSVELDNDFLFAFDGDSASATLVGVFTGSNNPGVILATDNNTSGCITFEFVSDESIVLPGWVASISCVNPCQTIVANLDSATPAPNAAGYIRVCTGESVTLNGSGTFSDTGAGATYEWDLDDGRTISGQSATFSYDTPGVYRVNLNIRDTNTSSDPDGCKNSNNINQVIQVSTEPDFTGTEASSSTICLGNTATIIGNVTTQEFEAECTPPVSGTTFLPDGTGAAYSTCINVDCFDSSQTLQNANQLVEICINMEHSWAGDLDIFLVSPNGMQVQLFENTDITTQVYLGAALDTDEEVPGEGRTYCFSMSASVLLKDAPQIRLGTPEQNTLEPGTYLPVQSFDNLIGSTLNGDWCLQIVDNIALDNGYIFEWNMNFDPSLKPAELSFTPDIVTEEWNADPSIISVNGSEIQVQPTTVGQHCYTFRTVDDFGCEYTEEVCIDVLPAITINNPSDYRICDNLGEIDGFGEFDLNTKNSEILGSQDPAVFVVSYYGTQTDAEQGTNPLPSVYTNTVNPQTIYARVDNNSDPDAVCYEITELLLEVLLIPELGLPESVSVCTDSNGSPQVADPVLDTGLSPVTYSFEWSLDGNVIPTETGPSIVASVGGLYTVLVTDNNTGCFNSDSTNVIESSPPVLTAQVISRPFADNNIIEATAAGFGDYEYSLNGGPFQSSGRFENVPPGANDIVARDINGCGTDAVSVVVLNYPRFFTPNGDGVNDIWNIGGLPPGSAAVVYIYDRYGKLLVQYNPRRNSWDGTFNGYTMPATDYWFTIDFNNPSNGNRETFQAHFSLRR